MSLGGDTLQALAQAAEGFVGVLPSRSACVLHAAQLASVRPAASKSGANITSSCIAEVLATLAMAVPMASTMASLARSRREGTLREEKGGIFGGQSSEMKESPPAHQT